MPMNFITSKQPADQERLTSARIDQQPDYETRHDYQYESLTGLLLQENTPTSFNDDESFRHHPEFGLEEELRAKRERDERRRARSFFKRLCWGVKGACCKRYDSPLVVLFGLCGILVSGSVLGMLMPTNPGDGTTELTFEWDTISNMLGYSYFLSWTLSFYPQIITNCKRPQDAKRGVSIEFLVWNMIGFACYAAYVTSFMYSDVVRKEYADRFGGGADVSGSNTLSKLIPRQLSVVPTAQLFPDISNSTVDPSTVDPPDLNITFNNNTGSQNASATNSNTVNDPMAVPQVKFNDVAFAWHALLLSIISYIQIVCCSKSKREDLDENEQMSSIECSVVHQTQSNIGWVTPQSEDEVFIDINQNEVSPGVGSVMFNEQKQMFSQRQKQSQEVHDQLDSLVESERGYKHKLRSQSISFTSKFLMIILLKFCIAGVLLVLVWSTWQWIDYLYFLSFVKVCISIVKYIPQAILNYERKSTCGWQIWNILLDFMGGTLSTIQLVGDSLAEARSQGFQTGWRGIAGNPAKLGLGLASIFFDVIFIVQHYVLYKHPRSRDKNDWPQHRSSLLEDSDYDTPLLPDAAEPEVIVFV